MLYRWQTKPKMTIHGDLYYEGKEFETRLKEKKPGDLSDELRRALGMPTGMVREREGGRESSFPLALVLYISWCLYGRRGHDMRAILLAKS